MTRETKVGLLVGIGVILLIGIIISDQLSVVQNSNPSKALARFGAAAQKSIFASRFGSQLPNQNSEKGAQNNTFNANKNPHFKQQFEQKGRRISKIETPSELQKGANRNRDLPPRAFALNRSGEKNYGSGNISGNSSSSGKATYHPVSMTLSGRPPKNANLDFQKNSSSSDEHKVISRTSKNSSVIHTVQKGETLYAIAVHYYHKGTDWRKIAKANPDKIDADAQIKVGEKLIIPDAGGSMAMKTAPVKKSSRPSSYSGNSVRKIKVQSGDTLAGLAHHYLGSSARWHELLKANSDKLDSPRDLRAGMTLIIPATTD